MVTTITRSDGTVVTEIPDNTLDTNTSLRLPGTGYKNYGQPVLDSMVWSMENFANTTAPLTPLPGQLWFDKTGNVLKLWDGSVWTTSGSIVNKTTAPSNPVVGTLWWDTTNQILNSWSGTAWIRVGPGDLSTYWNSTSSNTPSADNTYSLGNIALRMSSVWTYKLEAAGAANVTSLNVGTFTTLNTLTTSSNATVQGSLTVQNGQLVYNKLTVASGGANIAGSVFVNGTVSTTGSLGIATTPDGYYKLDVGGAARVANIASIEGSGPVYSFMKNTAAATDTKIWYRSIDTSGNLFEYVTNDGEDPGSSNRWLQVNRNTYNISNVLLYAGSTSPALSVNADQNINVEAGNLIFKLLGKGVTFADSTVQTTAGTWNLNATINAVTNPRISQHGYAKLPNGLVIQWGEGSAGESLYWTINFPTLFPNACLAVNVNERNASGWSDIGGGNYGITIYGASHFTPSNFRVYCVQNSSGTNTVPVGPCAFSYIAVGY